MYTDNEDQKDELMHFGVLGMHWGVRRYKNADGSLNDSGKKRVSQEYKKESIKATNAINKTAQKRQTEAYNKTVDDYNNGKLEKFNKKHDSNSKNYEQDYADQFNKDFSDKFNSMTVQEFVNNSHYKKGKAICDKYSMLSFDKLAKDNEELIKKFKF